MMHQRLVVIVAAIVLVVAGIAISPNPHQIVRLDSPPIVLERLGRGDRIFLHHDMKTYSYATSGPQSMSEEDAADFLGRTPSLNAAWDALESGNRQWDSGNHTNAIAQWHVVARKHMGTDAALAALSHIGQAARARGDTDGAKTAYTSLVAHPDPSSREGGFGMLDYSNYKHNACAELSDMYVESHDLTKALTYADLALNVHGFSDMCGVAVVGTHMAIDERIKSLRQAIAQKQSVRLQHGTHQ